MKEASRFGEAKRLYQSLAAHLRKKLKKQRLLLEKIEKDRKGVEEPALLRRRGELLLAGLSHAKKIDGDVLVPDPYDSEGALVRVPVDPRRDLVQNADRYFERSRRMERSIQKLETRIAQLTDELRHLETLELALENAVDLADLMALSDEMEAEGIVRRADTGSVKGAIEPLGPRRLLGVDECEILVGRSARSNEQLTFEMAKADDLWFHSSGVAGAHVVLRLPPGRIANDEQIRQAAAVAAYYSKARSSTSVEVLYTLRKHVRKIRKAPSGTVRVSQYSSIRVKPALPKGVEDTERNQTANKRE
jgi:predicted ribosome quality control (RQC) complex YloA/Tae2 family protein